MKKILTFSLTLVFLISLYACTSNKNNQNSAQENSSSVQSNDIVNITEKMFVTYINDIYTNTKDFIGKTIKIEGMYAIETVGSSNYYYVYRKGPGCCGNDGSMCGFEFTYDGKMPDGNDWIEVIGTLRTYIENGKTYLTIDARSVTIMDVRGAEIVKQ